MNHVKEIILKAQENKPGWISIEYCVKWHSVAQESVCMYQVSTRAQMSSLPRANAGSGGR